MPNEPLDLVTIPYPERATPSLEEIDAILQRYSVVRHKYEQFLDNVKGFFEKTPEFRAGPLPLVHSVRSRLKDPAHLREKVVRKWNDGPISPTTLHSRITDLAGVRVLHFHTSQFPRIHELIECHISEHNWFLHEDPKAYGWDPDALKIFRGCGIKTIEKDEYTSVHYVVRPHEESDLTCEIQVRTLFEEIWGEIDHVINYPRGTDSDSCREQLKVLAKLASTGTKLADSIFLTWKAHMLHGQSGIT
jgi:putative GTP pyrophosphokinase